MVRRTVAPGMALERFGFREGAFFKLEAGVQVGLGGFQVPGLSAEQHRHAIASHSQENSKSHAEGAAIDSEHTRASMGAEVAEPPLPPQAHIGTVLRFCGFIPWNTSIARMLTVFQERVTEN